MSWAAHGTKWMHFNGARSIVLHGTHSGLATWADLVKAQEGLKPPLSLKIFLNLACKALSNY